MIIPELTIGHTTRDKTGLSVFLFAKSSPCAYFLCGAAPATRDINVLDDGNLIDTVDALLFTGGSAYGLGAANGVMTWLKERGRGYPASTVVPIVPTAAIYDLHGHSDIPTAQDAYDACQGAQPVSLPPSSGAFGAGTGATVSKGRGFMHALRGGFGSASFARADGLVVQAFAVVNCIGDIVTADGSLWHSTSLKKQHQQSLWESVIHGHQITPTLCRQNTTLVAIITNARYSRSTLRRISKMASGGIAQAVRPAFSDLDGDIVFCVSLGELDVDSLVVGILAQELVRQAIINAVR